MTIKSAKISGFDGATRVAVSGVGLHAGLVVAKADGLLLLSRP